MHYFYDIVTRKVLNQWNLNTRTFSHFKYQDPLTKLLACLTVFNCTLCVGTALAGVDIQLWVARLMFRGHRLRSFMGLAIKTSQIWLCHSCQVCRLLQEEHGIKKKTDSRHHWKVGICKSLCSLAATEFQLLKVFKVLWENVFSAQLIEADWEDKGHFGPKRYMYQARKHHFGGGRDRIHTDLLKSAYDNVSAGVGPVIAWTQ